MFNNNVKRSNKLEDNVKQAYAMISKELCPSQMQNRIKDHPWYGSNINGPLNKMNEITQSMHDPTWAIYPYLSLT